MKNIRNNVFETNSSSVHTLTIRKNFKGIYDYNLHLSKRGDVLLFYLEDIDFGWGPAQYNDAYTKLNYLACLAFQCYQHNNYEKEDKLIKRIPEIYNLPDMKKLEKICKLYVKGFNRFVFYPQSFFHCSNNELAIAYPTCGIDHYSYEDYNGINDFLKQNHISIENFLFNPCVILNISNDNE